MNLRRGAGQGAGRGVLDDQMAEMVALRKEGKIAAIVISEAPLHEVRLVSAEVTCVQNAHSLLSRRGDEVLEYCQREGLAYVPCFPLGSAMRASPKVVEDPVVIEVAARRVATPVQVGLAWLLARADNVALIPGTSSLVHLEENLDVADVVLTDDDLADLEREGPPR